MNKQAANNPLCATGFHSCERLLDVLPFYSPANSRYWEVDVEESIKDENKYCSRHITFIRELSFYEVMRMLNSNRAGIPYTEEQENTNIGFGNNGNYNIGNFNNGNYNIGNFNKKV